MDCERVKSEPVGAVEVVVVLMDSDFLTIVSALAQKKSGNIAIGPIAKRLVEMMKAIHKTGHVLVDIKTENFMLAAASTKKAATASDATAESLAPLIRVLDLGLFQMYKDPTGHRPNEQGCNLQGTPLYASLNVHGGATPSRRDDVESLLYVIMELVIRMHAAVSGTVNNYEAKNKTDVSAYLPWSSEASDQATGTVKRAQVENRESELYRRMPEEAAQILFQCMQNVQSCAYEKMPQYSVVAGKLAILTIPGPLLLLLPRRRRLPRSSKPLQRLPPRKLQQLPPRKRRRLRPLLPRKLRLPRPSAPLQRPPPRKMRLLKPRVVLLDSLMLWMMKREK